MASTTSDLQITVQEGAAWTKRLTITVPTERVQRARNRVLEQVSRGMRLPGFRKGKLPPRIVEQRFGASIDQETIDNLVQEAYREALDAESIVPIAQGRVDDVKYDRGSDLTFEVEIEIQPEIELTALSGFAASRPPTEIGDDDVQNVIDRLRDEQGEWEPLEEGARPDYGDQVLVEITALNDAGEPTEEARSYRVVLGEEQAIPDVEAAILTLVEGESGEFSVAFPEDFPDEERRGEEQKLKIAALETRRKALPEVDDAFAAAVGDFESVDALRERVRTDLEADSAQRAESEVRTQLIDQVIEANPFDPPASMLERYLDFMMGIKEEGEQPERSPEEEEQFAKVRESVRPQAEWGLKRTLIVERIAEMEGLGATQDEIDARVESLAEKHEISATEAWLQLEKSGQLEALEREITEDKVFGFLAEHNTVA